MYVCMCKPLKVCAALKCMAFGSFGLKTGIHFTQFGLELGMDFVGILFICVLIQVMMT